MDLKGHKNLLQEKRVLHWKYRMTPTSINKDNLMNYSKKLKKIINLTQKSQDSHYIYKAVNKSKATWQIINKGKKNKRVHFKNRKRRCHFYKSQRNC